MYVRKKALELAGRKLLANATMSTFTGTWEQDDSDNWQQVTQAARGTVSKRLPMNYMMGLGEQVKHDQLPGMIAKGADHNQRNMYRWWREYMTMDSWPELMAKVPTMQRKY